MQKVKDSTGAPWFYEYKARCGGHPITVVADSSDHHRGEINGHVSYDIVMAWIAGFNEGYLQGRRDGVDTVAGTLREIIGAAPKEERMSPIRIPSAAGKPYRPSNGTEGDMFMEKFCNRCTKLGPIEDSCQLLLSSLIYETSHPAYPKEWVFDADGRPTCTAFEAAKKEDDKCSR